MPKYLTTSESVSDAHPDKVCDQISDAILDAIIREDAYARVACEVLITTGLVVVTGEMTTKCYVDVTGIVREKLKRIGYSGPISGFDYQTCAVIVMIDEQCPEIGLAVDRKGAGDQGMMVGYATNESEAAGFSSEYMPVPIFLAHGLTRRLKEVRESGILPYLRPDGKSQVTVEYDAGKPISIDTLVLSAQHSEEIELDQLRQDLKKEVIDKVLVPTGLPSEKTKYLINPAGKFISGGPRVDVGLTGRKVAVDSYGISARNGGAALSGKDPTKTDRSGSYAARYVAKNVVAAGLAARCEIQLAYAIGIEEPVSVTVDTFGTGKVKEEKLVRAIRDTFNLTPAGIIEALDLRRPIYERTAAYGHFGRLEDGFTWEVCDRINDLKKAVRKNKD
ncbi:MAG: S-adenosylmethionine synthetase [Latescibacteria bacterium DG_63]|nr:MAG: S-adenosylmethionine synthetase [Latescibacteria bacterium DG_63]